MSHFITQQFQIWPVKVFPFSLHMFFQVHNGGADSDRESLRQRPAGVHGCKRFTKHTHISLAYENVNVAEILTVES